MNRYDTSHRVSHHCKMSDEEWEDAYRAAWATYYTPDHMRTIIRRSAACRLGRPEATMLTLLFVSRTIPLESVHPLEDDFLRLKFRRDRRPGMKIENPLVFYPRYGWETAKKLWAYLRLYRKLKACSITLWPRPIAGPIQTSRSQRGSKTNSSGYRSITIRPGARLLWHASAETMPFV